MAPAPSTFDSIELQAIDSAALPFAEFVKLLLEKLQFLKDAQFAYYEGLRKKNTKRANGSRWVLALLGSIAFLLTALVALFWFIPAAELQKWGVTGADAFLLLLVLAIYAVMGAMSFYEKATDKTHVVFPTCRHHPGDPRPVDQDPVRDIERVDHGRERRGQDRRRARRARAHPGPRGGVLQRHEQSVHRRTHRMACRHTHRTSRRRDLPSPPAPLESNVSHARKGSVSSTSPHLTKISWIFVRHCSLVEGFGLKPFSALGSNQ